jgi:hypothetical protein
VFDVTPREAASLRVVQRTLSELKAAGQRIIYGKGVELMSAVDPSNPPSADQAKTLIASIATDLGCDPTDADAIRTAMEALFEAAGIGDDGAEGIASPVEAESAQKPKVVASSLVAEGKRRLGWGK